MIQNNEFSNIQETLFDLLDVSKSGFFETMLDEGDNLSNSDLQQFIPKLIDIIKGRNYNLEDIIELLEEFGFDEYVDIFKSNSTGEDELIEACWDILLDSDIGLANEVLTCIEDRDNLVYISDVIDINHDKKSYIVELIEPNFKVITQLRIYYEERVDDTYPIFDIIGKGIEKLPRRILYGIEEYVGSIGID